MLWSKYYFAAGMLRGQKADLFPALIISWGFVSLNAGFDLRCDAVWEFSLASRVKDHDVQIKNLYWKESAIKTFMLDVSNKWIIFMLSFRAVFIIEFCFGWLPQMAAMKFYLFPVSLGQVDFVLGLTSANHKARNWYPEMVAALTANNSDWSEEMKRKRHELKKHDCCLPKTANMKSRQRSSVDHI